MTGKFPTFWLRIEEAQIVMTFSGNGHDTSEIQQDLGGDLNLFQNFSKIF